MTEIVGTENKKFTGSDGTIIEGMTIYVTEDINPQRGQGKSTDHFFLSKAKLDALDFKPAPAQTIRVYYNRFGKPATLTLLSDAGGELVID